MKKIIFLLLILFVIAGIVKSQDKKKEFTPSGKVWGYVFGDYFYKAGGDTSGSSSMEYAKTPKDKNAFAFRRVYLGFDYNISERFSTEFIGAFDGSDLLGTDGKETFYIKIANIKWKNIYPYADLILGQMSTPTFALLSEKVWGYRNAEKTILDARKIGGSYDFGLGLWGKFDKEGTYGYNLMIGNGRGANLENNKFKKYYGSLYGYFADRKLIVEAYSDYEDLTPSTSKTTFKGFAAFQSEKFRLGVEAFQQIQKTGTITDDIKPFGVSAFAAGNLYSNKNNYLDINAFARYDYYDPDNNNSSSGYKESFITAGVDFQLDKNVHIIPNIWVNTYSNKLSGGAERKADIVPRITFSYLYK